MIRVNSATPEGKRFQIIHRIASLEQLIGSASCFNHRVGTEHLIRMLAAREIEIIDHPENLIAAPGAGHEEGTGQRTSNAAIPPLPVLL